MTRIANEISTTQPPSEHLNTVQLLLRVMAAPHCISRPSLRAHCQNGITSWDAWLSTCALFGVGDNSNNQLLDLRHLWSNETDEHSTDLIAI